jgi:hypothetical protein
MNRVRRIEYGFPGIKRRHEKPINMILKVSTAWL